MDVMFLLAVGVRAGRRSNQLLMANSSCGKDERASGAA
jgi:hypothetical protein